MQPVLRKGQLTSWKDDRGFGFIKPHDGSKEIFLHISALQGATRRPKVGDIILYEQITEPDGKVRAANASIQGVVSRPLQTKNRKRKDSFLETIFRTVFGIGIMITIPLLSMDFSRSRYPSPITLITKPGCTIKGNISISNGNKIYHLPGMEDYESTIIDLESGERWFCTESEAIAHGWQKAPR